ncbi:DegV family protein [Rhodococcus sp. IEGM 1379]|uniref:DegV family protein n=1 Tax=Rhodococcus sp. IEGM 1379 TaxID=3047086 RepID=UPI0024B75D62|nr:DegV family protein [Rhodococcus sp. IEGM 1379]MDI9919086.1 DegV family protein [Rhodococcus sp. IEGM 1379]
MSVVVVTDSSACIPRESADACGLQVVPLHVLRDGCDFLEGVDTIPDDMAGVTTAGASPAELIEAYGRALELSRGGGVVAVHISRQLSGTWEAGRQAALEFGGKVRIVDSASAGMGLGYPALEAARFAAAGSSLDDVFDRAVDVADRSRAFIFVDKLDQLRRGGRISTAAALLGTALAMKPLLHLVDGKLVLKEKTRTTTKALARLVDSAVERAGFGRVAIAVHHTRARERADGIAEQLQDRIPDIAETVVTDFSAVIGAHVGVGAIGVVVCQLPEPGADQ